MSLAEFLNNLLAAVIVAAVPILTTYAVKWIQTKKDAIAAACKSDLEKSLLEQVSNAVCQAVEYVNQTVVDAIKGTTDWTDKAKKAAFATAKEKVLAMLTTESLNMLKNAVGDVDTWIETKIEQQVRYAKAEDPLELLTPGGVTDAPQATDGAAGSTESIK